MLASTYRSAAELGLTARERTALIDVLSMLEGGHVLHVPYDFENTFSVHRRPRPKSYLGLFNMENVFASTDCGTAACIAGTSDWLFDTRFAWRGIVRGDLTARLHDLFCPSVGIWSIITVQQAARALRNYLERGYPRWYDVLAPESVRRAPRGHPALAAGSLTQAA